MTDVELMQLLRMAREAEEFGSGGVPMALPTQRRPVGRADPYRIFGWASAGLAVAAALTAAVILLRTDAVRSDSGTMVAGGVDPSQNRPSDNGVVVRDPATGFGRASGAGLTALVTADVKSTGSALPELRDSIIVAMYKGSDGTTRCVRVKSHEWDCGRGIEDLSEGELIGFAFESACDSVLEEGPESLVVLAMSGPKGSWSKETTTAEAITACLESSPEVCGSEASCYADVARHCLPAGVTVRAETMEVR